jgi:hypothetical protein
VISWKTQLIKLLFMKFSLVSCYKLLGLGT